MSADQGSYAELSEDWADDPWFRFPRAFIRDRRITWEARAIAAWMASHEATFRFSVDYIVRSGSAGRDKVRKVMAELEAAGYLKRVRVRNPDGSFGALVYRLHPRPHAEQLENPRSEPAPEIQGVVEAGAEPQNPRSEPAPDLPGPAEPSPANQEGYKEIKKERGREDPPSPQGRPSAEAAQLVASLSFGSHIRPTAREAAELGHLVDAAFGSGLSLVEIRRHAQAKVNQAKTNAVSYLRRGLSAEHLPIPLAVGAAASARASPDVSSSDAARAAAKAHLDAQLHRNRQARQANQDQPRSTRRRRNA